MLHHETHPAARPTWTRSLLLLPAGLLSLVPSATCPLCLSAYAGVMSAVGLGFLLTERVLGPLIAVLLLAGLASVAWSMRTHRHAGPLVATLGGSVAVVAGRLVWDLPLVLYTGVMLLVVASLWNFAIRRRGTACSIPLHAEGRRTCHEKACH